MTKRNRIIYWVSTLWLCLGMAATGIQQLLHVKAEGAVAPPGVDGIVHLGYPVHLFTLLGIWKLLGVVAVLVPRFALLKEWAYAGFFFIMSGAVWSHIAVGDAAVELVPSLLLLALTLLSWQYRPAGRRTTSSGTGPAAS